jgi:hypothetical protein
MGTSKRGKISVSRILTSSIVIAWQRREKFLTALALPTLLLVIIWALHWTFVDQSNLVIGWTVGSIYVAAFGIFAVTCHRLILVENQVAAFRLSVRTRELKFVGWLFVVYAIYYAISLAPLTVLMNSPIADDLVESPDSFYYAQILFSVPAMYILARLCLVFPATAIDKRLGLRWSWLRTRDNGWRIVIVIGIYPWIISTAIWLISREDATLVEQVLTALMYYVGLALEVFALSLTYKAVVAIDEEGALSA